MDYCSQIAMAADTPLYGTAAQFRVGLLIEYANEWRGKAIGNNDLPAEFNAWIGDTTRAIPLSRPLFICQDRAIGKNDEPNTFYVTVADPVDPKVYRFAFTDYAELMEIDVAAVAAGTSGYEPVDETIVAVCTNGKHDLCCAKFGMPVYHAFAAQNQPGEKALSVWQCTHIGGHRYAATAVVLPAGTVYGYLTPENVPTVTDAIRSDSIHLPCYRGSTLYPGTVSAADYFVREKIGQTGLDALTLVSAEETGMDEQGEAQWRVEFKNGSSPHHVVELAQWKTEPVISSCGNKPPKPQVKYRLVSHSTA